MLKIKVEGNSPTEIKVVPRVERVDILIIIIKHIKGLSVF